MFNLCASLRDDGPWYFEVRIKAFSRNLSARSQAIILCSIRPILLCTVDKTKNIYFIFVHYHCVLPLFYNSRLIKPSQDGPLHTPGASGSELGTAVVKQLLVAQQQNNKDQDSSIETKNTHKYIQHKQILPLFTPQI